MLYISRKMRLKQFQAYSFHLNALIIVDCNCRGFVIREESYGVDAFLSELFKPDPLICYIQ